MSYANFVKRVQDNIVAAEYAVASLVSGPALTVGSSISLRVTTPGYTTRYIAHDGTTVNTQVVTSSSTTLLQQQARYVYFPSLFITFLVAEL